MKPRNKFEKELQGYIDGGKLSPVTPKQMAQAVRIMDSKGEQIVCHTRQTINGMELIKYYKVHRLAKDKTYYMFNLVLILAKRGQQHAWAARHTGMCYYYIDSFSHCGDITIKSEREWYWGFMGLSSGELKSVGKADPYAVTIHRCDNDYLFMDSRIETLFRSHDAVDHELLDGCIESEKPLSKHIWQAYKIAKRNHYNFQGELWRWISLVNLLRTNGRDYRNPHFICPASLVDAHHAMIDIDDKRRARNEEEKRRRQEEEMLKRQKEEREKYIKEHKKWLGIVIIGNGIVIKPLQSVDEFMEEGRAMHHCVYTNGYYRDKDTLILSARDKDGNRLATIEYNLLRNRIVQCRAACNAKPERYNEICMLVMGSEQLNRKKQAA